MEELLPGQDPEEDNELYEEKSALTQGMESEERQNLKQGSFITGGNLAEGSVLHEEREFDEEVLLTPRVVRDGAPLMKYLRENLQNFEAPYAYIGGEANSPDMARFHPAEVKILIARLSTYTSVSLSMSHSLLAQIIQELPYTFCDITFLPRPKDYEMLMENQFPIWFGTNTKLGPSRFDILAISHPVNLEQLNFIPLFYDSGIPLFKQQRMEREDIPLVVLGGANSGTTSPLNGSWKFKDGREMGGLLDAVIYGDGEKAVKILIEVVREGKQKGWSKREILRACHGKVPGFYEPDKYVHTYKDGKIAKIDRAEGADYVEFPVKRSTIADLDEVRTLETKILPFTGDGASVDVAIAGNSGCIGPGGWGACSFCREGSESAYRERSLGKVVEALDAATMNQGTKEVSFFSLNFNQYKDFFQLIDMSVKRGYKVGLISQRIDMLAETPEQIRVQRWIKKTNFTLGLEGISARMRAYLNKNLQEWELLRVCTEFMRSGAAELKLFLIYCGIETEEDIEELNQAMEKINAIRDKMGTKTRFRISFTPLLPSAYTSLQFSEPLAIKRAKEKRLTPIFTKAKELGWGRRMSVSMGEAPLSHFMQQGGRHVFKLLVDAHFRDGFRFYGDIQREVWARWEGRIAKYGDMDLEAIFGEKTFEYIFPWEDFAYATSKEILWRGYLKCLAFQGASYCLTTRTVKGVCHSTECGACDPEGTGKPDPRLILNIVGRKTGDIITAEKIAETAKTMQKAANVRVLFDLSDPIYRFVLKSYFKFAIPRALMKASPVFNEAFLHCSGHARQGAATGEARDWVFGKNIYDFAVTHHISEEELKEMIEPANQYLKEGKIVDIRVGNEMMMLRKDVDHAVYTVFVPNQALPHSKLRLAIENYFQKQMLGKDSIIKVKKASGKDTFKTERVVMKEDDVRQLEYSWEPDYRGTLVRFVVAANYNPMFALEALTCRRSSDWKKYPIYCDGYIQSAEDTGDVDVFAALMGEQTLCSKCEGPLELDLFTGSKTKSGVCVSCNLDQFPVDMEKFFTKTMQAIDTDYKELTATTS